MKIQPLYDRVLVEPMEIEEKTEGGIVLPDTMDKEKPQQGKIIAVGNGKTGKDGKKIALSVKKGDVVLFAKYSPSEIKVEGKEYLIIKEEDILAILGK